MSTVRTVLSAPNSLRSSPRPTVSRNSYSTGPTSGVPTAGLATGASDGHAPRTPRGLGADNWAFSAPAGATRPAPPAPAGAGPSARAGAPGPRRLPSPGRVNRPPPVARTSRQMKCQVSSAGPGGSRPGRRLPQSWGMVRATVPVGRVSARRAWARLVGKGRAGCGTGGLRSPHPSRASASARPPGLSRRPPRRTRRRPAPLPTPQRHHPPRRRGLDRGVPHRRRPRRPRRPCRPACTPRGPRGRARPRGERQGREHRPLPGRRPSDARPSGRVLPP